MKGRYKEPLHQKERLSVSTLVITVFCLLLFVGVAWLTYETDNETGAVCALLIAVVVMVTLVGPLVFMPMSLTVDDEALHIRFSFRYKSLPFSSIESVELYQGSTNMVRTCGSGGFFGYWGWFYTRSLGKFFVYATTMKDLVLIKMVDGKKYMVSSPAPEELIGAIRSRL